ncbi:hypothetical protein [Vibrio metschnikovii]|uniref:hypothetical protein n=1 Tax=Vibrio metschnikovii TaxID=28172 RepID=UPI002FC84056|nr:hypothetical protein [Vibrio metschnikovii]
MQRNLELVVKFLDVEKDTRDKPYGYGKRLGTRLTLGPREAILLETALSGLKAVFPTAYHPASDVAALNTIALFQLLTLGDKCPKSGQSFGIPITSHVMGPLVNSNP